MPSAPKSYPLSLRGLDFSNCDRRTRRAHKIRHPFRLNCEDLSSKVRQPVITTASVIHFRIRPLLRLLDKPILKETVDGSIKRSRSQSDSSSALLAYRLHDRVAVSFAIREGD